MKYNTGTVAVTNGSTGLVGTGTKWLTNAAANQLFTVAGSGVTYQIASVTDDTHIVLAAPYGGATLSGLAYTIIQGFTPNFGYPYPDIGDVQTATLLKRALLMIDTQLTIVALAPRSAPAAPASGFILYCDAGDGNKLKAISAAGNITEIAYP